MTPAVGGPGVVASCLTPDHAMRRPHVYERSVPRARREACAVPDGDPVRAARSVLRALQAVIATADLAGLAHLVDLLDAARLEAERVEAGVPPATP